ncbi:MAG TPA: C40 family peptidase [Candidatus Mediterraneibacter intestinigallinarum]|nr:C40 family peptidase [Candidatus Mediterraneibacter intestinigallinarum]
MRLRKRVHSAVIATVLTCSMAVTPVFAEPDTLESLQEEQENLQNQKEAAQNELNSLQSDLDTIVTKLADLEDQLIAKGEEIIQIKADLEAAEEKRQEQYDAMKLRIKYMYEAGTGSATMEKVMSSGDISSMLTQAEYTQQVHDYDREQLQEYANTVQEIEDLQAKSEQELADLEDLESEYQQQEENLNSMISSKSDEVSNLDGMLQEAARKIQEEKDRQEAEAERQRQLEEQRRQQAAQQQSNNITTNTSDTTDSNTSSNDSSGGGSSEPSYSPVTGNAIVDRAYSKIGCWYEWGAVGPNTFDCSGLVSYALTGSYSRLGTTYTFMGWTRVSNPQPGDVCTSSTHCGIYIGNGQMIHAPHTGAQVTVGPVPSNMIYVRY